MVPVWAMPFVSVQPIGTASPGTSARTVWRTSERDEIVAPFSDVMTSPLPSPARSAGFPARTDAILAPRHKAHPTVSVGDTR